MSLKPTHVDQWRQARQLTTAIADAVGRAGVRYVLVTSAGRGDGKTLLVNLVEQELRRMATGQYVVLSWELLGDFRPGDFPSPTVVLVDGPPMREGGGILQIPHAWMEAFEGALVIVMKRVTPRADLEDVVSWLGSAGIRPLGVVWNEFRFPPTRTRLAQLRARLSGQRGDPAQVSQEPGG